MRWPWTKPDNAAAELREALAVHGIVLPSLRTDLAGSLDGRALLDLGRVNVDTARKLTEALRRAPADHDAEDPAGNAW